MQIATLVIAVIGVMLSTASLVWQATSFFLSGGRIKTELQIGAMGPDAMIHWDPSNFDQRQIERAARQGYTQPDIAVRVRNVGRLPVTVTAWSIDTTAKVDLRPMSISIGPSLPYRLEVGETEMWAVELEPVLSMVDTAVEVFKVPRKSVKVRGKVSLGDGRTFLTPESL